MGSGLGKRAANGCVNAEAEPARLQTFLSRVSSIGDMCLEKYFWSSKQHVMTAGKLHEQFSVRHYFNNPFACSELELACVLLCECSQIAGQLPALTWAG